MLDEYNSLLDEHGEVCRVIGVIQMQKPRAESPDYYVSFYNMYNLLQINDAAVFQVFDEAKKKFKLTTEHILDCVNTDNFAIELLDMFPILGVEPPENIIEMSREDRGMDTSFAHVLLSKKIDPFDWFRKVNEFMQLYGLFEQALKEFLEQKGCKGINESNVVDKLIGQLEADKLADDFLEVFSYKTFGIVENFDEARAIWSFFTRVRNCMAHSGGRITQKVIDGFNEIKSKYRGAFKSIEAQEWLCEFFLLKEDDDYTLFNCSYSLGDIVCLDNSSLNFFRMFCVFFIETLSKTAA